MGCSIPFGAEEKISHQLFGRFNYHFPIYFDDDEVWICRVRRQNALTPPVSMQNVIVRSEVATLNFLANIHVPVPRVHGFALHSPDNAVGMAYILMDMLEGYPLRWHKTDEPAKTHLLEQLADIYIRLYQHPFPAIGCLFPSAGNSTIVGPLTWDEIADINPDGSLSLLGPFQDLESYLTAVIKRNLDFIVTGKAYESGRLDAYLVHLYLLDCVPKLSRHLADDSAQFFLRHVDDKGSHILVDDDYNIVGMIDWEWAQIVPKAFAFATPLFLIDNDRYFDGDNGLSEDEEMFAMIMEKKKMRKLASLIRGGRLCHRIVDCIGGNVAKLEVYTAQFTGLQKLILGADHPEVDWQTWKARSLEKYGEDLVLQQLLHEGHEGRVISS